MTDLTRRTILAAVAGALALGARSGARRRRNTTPARATPRSRSATPSRIAARPRPTARSARREAAYFKMINDEGGINGRKINFISYDDGYSPPKTVEQARKLVESDERAADVQARSARRPTRAIQQIHERQEGAAALRRDRRHQMGRPEELPVDDGLAAELPERRPHLRAVHPEEHSPNGKIGILYQNDDYGKDYVKGLKDGLGDKAKSMIVAEVPYETTDPTVNSQIVSLKASGADVFFNVDDAEIRRAGDHEGGRDRLEAAAPPQQRRRTRSARC